MTLLGSLRLVGLCAVVSVCSACDTKSRDDTEESNGDKKMESSVASHSTSIATPGGSTAISVSSVKEEGFDALVTSKNCEYRKHCYNSLSQALAQAPKDDSLYRVHVDAGVYFEKLDITRNNVALVGAGRSQTVLRFNLPAENAKALYPKRGGTAGSATLTTFAKNITIKNLTIENSFDFLTQDSLPNDHPAKVKSRQAVALFVGEGSDKVVLSNVKLHSNQDTLYLDAGRTYITYSDIFGNVDFIFGAGQAFIENSNIISIRRGKKMGATGVHGHITAASTQTSKPFGFVFKNCRLLRGDGVPDHSTSLGRPWHPTTTFSDGRYADPNAVGAVLYVDTFMDKHILPYGWESMKGTARDGTKTDIFTPESSRFYELNSTGPGAVIHEGRKIFSEKHGNDITVETVFDGWMPGQSN